jgi:hypothetical protein
MDISSNSAWGGDQTKSSAAGRKSWIRLIKILIGLTAGALLLWLAAVRSSTPRALAEVAIADGRIIVIEAVTFGTNHVVGRKSFLVDRFGPWMPQGLRGFLQPKAPQSSMKTDHDSLIVWVNALSSVGRTNVDCQGIRVEFEDSLGDLWGEETHGVGRFKNQFMRSGHVFSAYPRAALELRLRIVPRQTNAPVSVKFANPRPSSAAAWDGESLPARRKVGATEIVLAGLTARTNGGPDRAWETPSKFWQPEWQILSNGKTASDWRSPEWTASDAFGNRGQSLGVHQPALRYSVKFWPSVTNQAATEFVAALPSAFCSPGATNTLWFKTNLVNGHEVVAIGLMTAKMTHFTDGQYDPKPPMPMGPTSGGPPTGWVSSSRRLSPIKVQVVRGHYSDRPVIYLECNDRETAERLGIRLRDAQQRVWPTTREGTGAGIIPFMLDVPADVTNVVPEIVLLKPVEAEFTVKTPVGNTP